MKQFVYVFLLLTAISCKNPKPNKSLKTTFAGFEINYELTEIDVNAPKAIHYASGNNLKIPENAFVDAYGNTLEGIVDIRYREYPTASDVIVANINLVLNQKNNQFLEPALLFDFNPRQNGQDVFINQKKPIEMKIPSSLEMDNYQLYFKKDRTSSYGWQIVGKDKSEQKKTKDAKTITLLENGVYALAKVYQMKNPVNIEANFLYQGKAIPKNSKIFHITGKENNAIIEYTTVEDVLFKFNPKDDNTLIVVFPDDRVATFSQEEFARLDITKLEKNKKFTFQLKPEIQKPTSNRNFQQTVQRNMRREQTNSPIVIIRQENKEIQQKEKIYTGECVLMISSATKFPLYQNCVNELETVGVGICGTPYRPTFEVNNGRAVKGEYFNQVNIIPSTVGTCELTVYNQGQVVGSQEFRVNAVPKPSIVLTSANGNEVNTDNPIPNVNTLVVVPKPDENFLNTLPKEANYRVVAGEISQFRNGRTIATKLLGGGTISMAQFDGKPGDGFQAKVTQVQRIGVTQIPETVTPVNTRLAFFLR